MTHEELVKWVDQRVSERFWSEVAEIVSIATRTNKPVKTVIDALEVLGFEMEGER